MPRKVFFANSVPPSVATPRGAVNPRPHRGFSAERGTVLLAKSRKNYAGTSPLTVASGKKRAVLARRVRNRRLYAAIDQWALGAMNTGPGARAFYDQQPNRGLSSR